jgi:hypothetical protein
MTYPLNKTRIFNFSENIKHYRNKKELKIKFHVTSRNIMNASGTLVGSRAKSLSFYKTCSR